MSYIVYETKNLLNGRFYRGVHKTETPFEFDGYLGSNRLLKSAISKYGKENFSRKTLCEFDCASDAFEMEELVVETVKENPKSYNLEPGGRGNVNLGKYVVENNIGIMNLSFEERSANSKRYQASLPAAVREERARTAGLKGGASARDKKAGWHGLDKETRIKNAKNANAVLKTLGKGFFDPAVQSELGKKGGVKNKGCKWYNDGIKDFKYMTTEVISFEMFLETNPSFSAGRIFRSRSK